VAGCTPGTELASRSRHPRRNSPRGRSSRNRRRSHQTAYAALKQKYKKVGDRWKRKDHKGPSDPGGHRRGTKTYGGVDVEGNTRDQLYKRASKLGVSGRSTMNKKQLAEAIAKKQ
jgi:hypothetical protein